MITLPRPTRQVVPQPTREVVRRHALIHARASAVGHVWHGRAVDAGIDGTIELRDTATSVMSNRLM